MLCRVLFVLVLLSSTPLISRAELIRDPQRGFRSCAMSVELADGFGSLARWNHERTARFQGDVKDHPSFPEVRVITPRHMGTERSFWVDVDVLWSPDSQFIALSGNYNGYTNGW